MKFRDFLQEQTEKHAVMAFGRMNPITIGHEKLVNKVKDIAKEVGGTAHIVVSHSQDAKKNPLTAAQKLKHAKRAFPGTHVSTSDKESPNFLAQAAKLHKQGVTHFHMVGGSDRVEEYHKLLHKYNGVKGPHGHYNFKHIQVHSAGARDPDAEGVEGMSASKMREHASGGNFHEFRKGVPSAMNDSHAREMYHDVRKGMGVKEDIDLEFDQLLQEGVHDKGIFKAVFLGGGPGSGKDFVLDKTLSGHGMTEINSDKAFEFLMDKNNLDMKMPENQKEARNLVRGRAKDITELRQRLALMGRNGLIINGTGDDVDKIKKIKSRLEELGYETQMIMVNTADEVSKQRNIERGQRGGRTVPEEIRKEKWDSVQAARAQHAKLFGNNYFEFDNSEDLREAPPEVVQAKEKEMLQLYKNVQKFVNKPPKNDNAKQWVATELQKKDTFKVDTKKEVVPHEGSKAAEQAREMGLQYFGFGRYGKNGKVTHRSVHDKLVEVQSEIKKNVSMPVPGTSMTKKKVNEEFESLINEDYQLSDSGALNLLLLGNSIDEHDFEEWIEEKKETKYLTDGKGRIRVFMLRRAAAKEAHQKNGTVYPYKNGYVVKLNDKRENQNVQISEELIFEQTTGVGRKTSFGWSDPSSNSGRRTSTNTSPGAKSRDDTGKEEGAKALWESKKITLSEIRERQKEKVKESIDKGIEPGLSMSAAGENPSRSTHKTKALKKPFEESMGGGEMATSMSDQKEDELKKRGINLSTFKARRPIG